MWRMEKGAGRGLQDVDEFIAMLNGIAAHPTAEARKLFDPKTDIVLARAPGRLDLMGGIADYSGSLVLQMPIREATLCALQKSYSSSQGAGQQAISPPSQGGAGGVLRKLGIVSLGGEGNHRATTFEMLLDDFTSGGQPIEYSAARQYFSRNPEKRWAAYAAGVFLVLMREKGAAFSSGANILISSQVPEGKGVSSSAAIEVAVMTAVAGAFGIQLEPRETAILCQKVENLIVGAPCGIMDQTAPCCGRQSELLALLCQPAELQGTVPVPSGMAVWGLDSGVRHSVSGADYGSVRVGAFMGYRIIAARAGLKAETSVPGAPVKIHDPRWKNYLANVTPREFETEYKEFLPDRMQGRDFIHQYGGTTDTVTRIDSDKSYAVRVPTAHPIYENERVHHFREVLRSDGPLDDRLSKLGRWMYQSHASYSACGLGSDGTDRLVRLCERAGPEKGIYGAKITGGGSGGTVAILGKAGSDGAIQEIAALYAKQTGHQPYVFAGSSPGAAAFSTTVLRSKG